ncbi:MAG: hypothetical protein MJ069_10770 [Salinivirgaceae bacterium]|nr:hypothetical protein [Salinivirgaceae bacterium]
MAQDVIIKKKGSDIDKLIRNNLESNHSVYITDNDVYCLALSSIADSSNNSYDLELTMVNYGDQELIKKFAKNYDIQWDRYPLLRTMVNDTIKPNKNYPLWANAMLGDSVTINDLVEKFIASVVFSEKEYFVKNLSRTCNNRIIESLIEEYKKDVYYYDRYTCACYSSKWFLIYWLRHLYFQEQIFCDLFKNYIQDECLYYVSTDDIDEVPLILNSNKSVKDFINQNASSSGQAQYLKQVESFVINKLGYDIGCEMGGLLWFYYVTEIEK